MMIYAHILYIFKCNDIILDSRHNDDASFCMQTCTCKCTALCFAWGEWLRFEDEVSSIEAGRHEEVEQGAELASHTCACACACACDL